MRKKSKLWQAFLAISISILTVPSFVQGQTASVGGSTGAGGNVSSGTIGGTAGNSGSPTGGVGSTGTDTSRSPSSMTGPRTTPGSSGMSATPTVPGSIPSGSGMTGGVVRDQSMTNTDRDLNGRIRESLSSDSALNEASQSVRINTDNGVVTLQGSVATEKEREDLETKIKHMTGVDSVSNQLQIAPRSGASTTTGSSVIR